MPASETAKKTPQKAPQHTPTVPLAQALAQAAPDEDSESSSKSCSVLQARFLATLLGLGFILPWAAANNSLPYYGQALNYPQLPFILNLAYCAPFLPVPVMLLALAARAPRAAQLFYRVSIPIGFLALATCMALLPLLPGRGVGGVWLFALLAGVAPGVLSNIIQTSVFALNASLSPHMNPYVWAGQGCAGVLAAALQLAAKSSVGSAPAAEDRASQLYFSATAVIAVACAVAWEAYVRHPYVLSQRAVRAAEEAAHAEAAAAGRSTPRASAQSPAPAPDAENGFGGSGSGSGSETGGEDPNDKAPLDTHSLLGGASTALARGSRLGSVSAGDGGRESDLPPLEPSELLAELYADSVESEASLRGLLPRLWDLWAVLVLNFAVTFFVMPLTFSVPYVGQVARIAAFAPPADAAHAWWSIILFACYNVGDTCAYFSRTAGLAIPGCGARRPQLLAAALLRAGVVIAGFLLLDHAEFGAANDIVAVAFCLAYGFSSGYIESSAMFFSENGRGIVTAEGRALVGNVGGNCVVFGLFLGGVCSYAWTWIG